MFRSRRNALLKRLWRQARGGAEQPSFDIEADGEVDDEEEQQQQVKSSSWIKSAAHALFKRLTDDQLALLLDALDGEGATTSPCLPLDTDLFNSMKFNLQIYF